MEIEFDIEQLFSLTYSCQPLKELLQKLVDGHNNLAKECKDIRKKLEKEFIYKFNLIDDRLHILEDETVKHRSQIFMHSNTLIRHGDMLEEHDAILKNFKGRAQADEPKDRVTPKEIIELRQQISLIEEMVKSHDTYLTLANKSLSEQKHQLNTLSRQTNENIEDKKINNDSLKFLESKLSEIEHNIGLKANNDEINKLFQMMMDLQKEVFEKIEVLNIGFENPQFREEASEAELKFIRDELKKFNPIQEKIDKILESLGDFNLEEMKKKILGHSELLAKKIDNSAIVMIRRDLDSIKKDVENSRGKGSGESNTFVMNQGITSEIEGIKKRLDEHDAVYKEIEEAKNNIRELFEKYKHIEPRVDSLFSQKNLGGYADIDSEAILAIKNNIKSNENNFDNLKESFEKFKKDVLIRLTNIEEDLRGKANLNDLNTLKSELKILIESILNGMQKKFADANETRKALKLLEKQIRLLLKMRSKKQKCEDAMLTKKQLFPYACASCEKDLVNMQAKSANYYSWNKFPSRDVNPKIKNLIFTKTSNNLIREEAPVLPKHVKLKNTSKLNDGSDDDQKNTYLNQQFFVEEDLSARPSTAAHATSELKFKKSK